MADEVTRSNKHILGDGAASDKLIEFDEGSGASRPKIKWNESTSKLQFAHDGTSFSDFGSGSGGGSGTGSINYIANDPDGTPGNHDAEDDAAGWVTYADAAATTPVDGTGGSPNVTFSRQTSNIIRGAASFRLAKDAANRQGQGVSYDFKIDAADKTKQLYISFDVDGTGANYAADDIKIYVYDVDAAALITPSVVNVKAAKYKFEASFLTSTSDDYRLIFHISTTNAAAYNLDFDNVSVGPDSLVDSAPLGPWKTFSSTWVATSNPTKGTIVRDEATYQRIGSSMHIRLNYEQSAAGTAGSGTYRLTIPEGLSIDTSILGVATNADVNLGTAYVSDGNTDGLSATNYVGGFVTPYDSTHLGIVYPDQSAGNLRTNRLQFGTAAGLNFSTSVIHIAMDVIIPIAEWSGASVSLDNTRIEYAYTTGTWDANDSTTGYGPNGQAMGGTLATNREKTITWLYPVQATDLVMVQASKDRTHWQPIHQATLGPSNEQVANGANSVATLNMGVDMRPGATSTQSIVTFRRFMNLANDDSPSVEWPSTNAFWRVVKCSNPLSVGSSFVSKFQQKILAANKTTTGVITDFSYTLEVGKTYRITANVTIRNPASTSTLIISVKDGSTVIGTIQQNETANVDATFGFYVIRTMTNTALTFDVTTNSAVSTVLGNGTASQSYVTVEELTSHLVYSLW